MVPGVVGSPNDSGTYRCQKAGQGRFTSGEQSGKGRNGPRVHFCFLLASVLKFRGLLLVTLGLLVYRKTRVVALVASSSGQPYGSKSVLRPTIAERAVRFSFLVASRRGFSIWKSRFGRTASHALRDTRFVLRLHRGEMLSQFRVRRTRRIFQFIYREFVGISLVGTGELASRLLTIRSCRVQGERQIPSIRQITYSVGRAGCVLYVLAIRSTVGSLVM